MCKTNLCCSRRPDLHQVCSCSRSWPNDKFPRIAPGYLRSCSCYLLVVLENFVSRALHFRFTFLPIPCLCSSYLCLILLESCALRTVLPSRLPLPLLLPTTDVQASLATSFELTPITQQVDPMASKLLHCCICPKQPNFSDSSHLLTHVSSKGHLSHLHKLQVRSHQEIAASQQLSLYNQWFAEHNVAQLLSERMQQKERKQAKRRADNRRRCSKIKQESQSNVDPSLLLGSKELTASGSEPGSVHASQNSSSVSSLIYGGIHSIEPAAIQNTSPHPAGPLLDSLWFPKIEPTDDSVVSTISPEHRATPEAARLKGIIWPGMDMFDSADEVTQRKRNQKKDVSVLRKMQAMSELVEPFETVCSPGGTLKKKRNMDELEDDSPVEGESPVTKPSSKRKRRPLATLSSNAPLPRLRRARVIRKPALDSSPSKDTASNTRTPVRKYFRRDRLSKYIDNPSKVIDTASRSSFKKPDFTIFEDHTPTPDRSEPYRPVTLPNPFLNGRAHHDRTLLSYPTATEWLQPPLPISPCYDPFKSYRSQRVYSGGPAHSALEKENFNPLNWQIEPKATISSPVYTSYGNFDDLDETLGPLAEVYAFIKNPLLAASPGRDDRYQTPQYARVRKYESVERSTHTFR